MFQTAVIRHETRRPGLAGVSRAKSSILDGDDNDLAVCNARRLSADLGLRFPERLYRDYQWQHGHTWKTRTKNHQWIETVRPRGQLVHTWKETPQKTRQAIEAPAPGAVVREVVGGKLNTHGQRALHECCPRSPSRWNWRRKAATYCSPADTRCPRSETQSIRTQRHQHSTCVEGSIWTACHGLSAKYSRP